MIAQDEQRAIIIKRKKVVSSGGHHGGAWKVAYADFVTAMMAFFLLMWLLNATTEDQRKGLADYFTPKIPISRTSAGGTGMLGGTTIFTSEHATDAAPAGDISRTARRDDTGTELRDDQGPAGVTAPGEPAGPGKGGEFEQSDPATAAGGEDVRDPEEAAREAAEEAERARLEEIEHKIAEAMRHAEGGALERHFILHMTPEGLTIEIIDAADQPLFASASAKPAPVLELLMDVLVPVLNKTLNGIAVVGHTDAVPYGGDGYSNWELSADRANAARRMLARRGLPEDRIVRVTGKAAVEPLVPDRVAPQNRRIAITLLREGVR